MALPGTGSSWAAAPHHTVSTEIWGGRGAHAPVLPHTHILPMILEQNQSCGGGCGIVTLAAYTTCCRIGGGVGRGQLLIKAAPGEPL